MSAVEKEEKEGRVVTRKYLEKSWGVETCAGEKETNQKQFRTRLPDQAQRLALTYLGKKGCEDIAMGAQQRRKSLCFRCSFVASCNDENASLSLNTRKQQVNSSKLQRRNIVTVWAMR